MASGEGHNLGTLAAMFGADDDTKFLQDVMFELARARTKFPSSILCVAALMEEVGELAQAMLKVHAGKWPQTRIRDEAVQVAVMAMRVAIEGDASFDCQYTEVEA